MFAQVGGDENEFRIQRRLRDAHRHDVGVEPSSRRPEHLAIAFIGLNRYDEAKQVLQQALAQKLETDAMHTHLFHLAFVKGDAAGMKQELDWAAAKSPSLAQTWQAQAAEFYGQSTKADQFSQQALDIAQRNGAKEAAAHSVYWAKK